MTELLWEVVDDKLFENDKPSGELHWGDDNPNCGWLMPSGETDPVFGEGYEGYRYCKRKASVKYNYIPFCATHARIARKSDERSGAPIYE